VEYTKNRENSLKIHEIKSCDYPEEAKNSDQLAVFHTTKKKQLEVKDKNSEKKTCPLNGQCTGRDSSPKNSHSYNSSASLSPALDNMKVLMFC